MCTKLLNELESYVQEYFQGHVTGQAVTEPA